MNRDKKIKVIIADDNASFLEGLNMVLAKSGRFEVLDQCSDGMELVKCKNLGRAELLLIDIEMPNLSGLEAAVRINYHFRHIPMIALTMHMESVYLNEIIESGFKGFIHKPDVSHSLFEVIEQVIRKKFSFPRGLKTNHSKI